MQPATVAPAINKPNLQRRHCQYQLGTAPATGAAATVQLSSTQAAVALVQETASFSRLGNLQTAVATATEAGPVLGFSTCSSMMLFLSDQVVLTEHISFSFLILLSDFEVKGSTKRE